MVLPLPSSSTLIGQVSSASSIRARCQAFGVTVVALVPSAGPVPPPMIVVMPAGQRGVQDGRADQVHVAVDRAGGEDLAVAGDDLGARADHQVGVHAVHGVRVAGLAERHDPAVADADVGLDDAPVVEHDRAGDHRVRGALGAGGPGLAHRLADHLAAAEDHLVAGRRAGAAVLLDLDQQVGVGEPDPVAGGRAVEGGVPPRSMWSRAHLRGEGHRGLPFDGWSSPVSSSSEPAGSMSGGRRARAPAPCPAGRRPGRAARARSAARPAAPARRRGACPARSAPRCRPARRAGAPRRRPGRSPAPRWTRRSGSASRPAPAGRRCCARSAPAPAGPVDLDRRRDSPGMISPGIMRSARAR